MPLIAETRQRYTVVTNPDAPRAHTLRRLTSDSAEKVARRVRTYKNVSGYALDLTAEEAAALRNTAGVESVEPVVERWASGIVPGQVAPNYERYDPQVIPWGIPVVRAAEVWPVTRGEGINVAVLDTGLDWNHPDLQAAYAGGVNILDETKLPIDDNKHGTHVAGIIAATQNDFGIVGVAPGVKLWNVKVLDVDGQGLRRVHRRRHRLGRRAPAPVRRTLGHQHVSRRGRRRREAGKAGGRSARSTRASSSSPRPAIAMRTSSTFPRLTRA